MSRHMPQRDSYGSYTGLEVGVKIRSPEQEPAAVSPRLEPLQLGEVMDARPGAAEVARCVFRVEPAVVIGGLQRLLNPKEAAQLVTRGGVVTESGEDGCRKRRWHRFSDPLPRFPTNARTLGSIEGTQVSCIDHVRHQLALVVRGTRAGFRTRLTTASSWPDRLWRPDPWQCRDPRCRMPEQDGSQPTGT